jgi:feruloyl esterase
MQPITRAHAAGRLCRAGFLTAVCGTAAIAGATSALAADACASLNDLKVEDTTITAAESVPAGSFTAGDSKSYANLPSFCRVTATISPVHDSAIRVEMWLPQEGWKGVFEGTGTGGFGGRFIYPALASGLRQGYAVINSDEGTVPATALSADDLVGHPVKWRDWGFRAAHLMTAAGKAIAQAFYGKAPAHAYFSGCSTGGQQALIEAQLYPTDYDGIVAGAPVGQPHPSPRGFCLGLSGGARRARRGSRARQAHAAQESCRRGLQSGRGRRGFGYVCR